MRTHCSTRWLLWTAVAWLGTAPFARGEVFDLHFGYVIPADRTPQAGGVAALQEFIPSMRDWYGQQMQRFGFGYKTFRYQTEADGYTPLVHVANVGMSAEMIRSDIWGNTINSAAGAGLSVWNPSDVWLLVPEAHQQQPDSSIVGGVALGASFGSGSDPGVAMIGGDALFRATATQLTNNTLYNGQIVPQIGPLPLVQNVSFPWFEGNTFSSIASSAQGAIAHELGHAFGLPHDFRNDQNFHGNLEGNGLRGWRGSLYPELYPADDIQLTYASALVLNTSRYFNPDLDYSDNTKPDLVIGDSGAVNIVDGKLQVHFAASDPSGLSAALLIRNGDVIEEMALSGNDANLAFSTPYFSLLRDDEFAIALYDTQGNRQFSSVRITPQGTDGVAPQPFLNVLHSNVRVGETVELSGALSSDPDGFTSSLQFEWDLTGNGDFTPPSSNPFFSASYSSPGNYLVRLRVTDPDGYWSVSAPWSVWVAVPEPATWCLAVTGVAMLLAFRRLKRG